MFEQRLGYFFAAELPDDGAQLEIGGETHTVVDAPDARVFVDQNMARLAVGVVGQNIERAHRAKLIVQILALFKNREVVLVGVGLDQQLHRTFATWAVAQHGWWHEAHTHRFRKSIGGDFTAVKTGFEVP